MAISNIWQINDATFSSRNLEGASLQVVTQAPDTLSFTQANAYDAAPEFAYGSTVTVKRANAQWFKGICTAISRRGTGTSERINYQISGPWWQLQKVIYRQDFTRIVGFATATVSMAKLILGTDSAGERINSGQVITAVVNYAIAQLGSAALFQLGAVQVATEMPYEELNALSCTEVITRCLRWNPDVVAYFDYSTTIPTLNFKRRTNLEPQTLAHADVTITEASINPRDDLQVNGVVVQYERTDTVDGNPSQVVITESAGDAADPTKTLYFFFDLQGSSVSYNRQKVSTESILESSGSWWQNRHPKLKNATGVSVANDSQTAVDDGGENDGTSYSKELVSGSIADWMGGVGTCAQIVKADVTYTPADGTPKTETLRLQIVGTNANNQTYQTVSSSTAAEPQPTGLAASILSGLSALQYEGQIDLNESDTGAATHLNKRINLDGGRIEWASMNAQVYSVNYALDTGTTQIAFGPAKHLGANDLFQLLRNVRTRKATNGTSRAQIGGGGQDLPTRSPNTTTADDGGGGQTPPLNAYKTGADTIKMQPGTVDGVLVTSAGGGALDAADFTVTDGYRLWLKVTLDVEGGTVQTAVMVSSDPDADTATVGSRLAVLCSITAGVLTITNYLSGSQDHDSCGSNHSFLLT